MVVSNFTKKWTLAYFSKNDPWAPRNHSVKVWDQLDTRLNNYGLISSQSMLIYHLVTKELFCKPLWPWKWYLEWFHTFHNLQQEWFWYALEHITNVHEFCWPIGCLGDTFVVAGDGSNLVLAWIFPRMVPIILTKDEFAWIALKVIFQGRKGQIWCVSHI